MSGMTSVADLSTAIMFPKRAWCSRSSTAADRAAQRGGGAVGAALRAGCAHQGPARVSQLLSLRVCRPDENSVEAAAVVGIDQWVRAVAARFEHGQTGW
jgi:hypothetical protein